MNNVSIMEKSLREKLDRQLKLFGMTISGGSYDCDTETWWVTLNNGVCATYDQYRVAELLLKRLEAQKIVLDGIGFTKQELDERNQRLQEQRDSKKRWKRSPKMALA